MPRIIATPQARKVVICGQGIRVDTRFEIGPDAFVVPPSVGVSAEELEERTSSALEYAAILSMGGQATLAIEVNDAAGGEKLAARGWNALWLFGLLSLASRVPCLSMFAYCDGPDARYSLAARSFYVIPQGSMCVLSETEAKWARDHFDRYHALIASQPFSAALRAHTNAHYLFDLDQRLMLIWAGIEGLLGIDSELRRRIALHAGLMLEGTREKKIAHFRRVQKAYDFRSRVVHGSPVDDARLVEEYTFATQLLLGLLAQCVTLGRVPSAKELDERAVSADPFEV